jgi:hypothetical protein
MEGALRSHQALGRLPYPTFMKRKNHMGRIGRIAVGVVGALILAVALSALPGTQQRDEPLMNRKGVPLSRVLKDPRAKGPVVVIRKDVPSGPGLVEPGAGQRQLEWMAHVVPIALVVHVDQVVPRLTPGEDWIVSVVSATIETVVKQPSTELLSPGQIIEFQQDGGELMIDERPVRGVVPYSDPQVAGRRYLVFASRNPDDVDPLIVGPPGWLSVYEPTSYVINPAGRLHSQCTGNGCRWPFSENGVELSQAIRRITIGKEAK